MADTLLTSGRFICSHWDFFFFSKQNCCKGYLNPECQLGIKCSLLRLSFLVWNVQILKIGSESVRYSKTHKWKERLFPPPLNVNRLKLQDQLHCNALKKSRRIFCIFPEHTQVWYCLLGSASSRALESDRAQISTPELNCWMSAECCN